MVAEVLVLAEQKQGTIPEPSRELACLGRNLADKLGGRLCAVLLGNSTAELIAGLGHCGVDKIYFISDLPTECYPPKVYTETIATLVSGHPPEIVLCSATSLGRDLASRLAARLKTQLAPDCVALDVNEQGSILLTRPVYGSRLNVTVTYHDTKPWVATVCSGIVAVNTRQLSREVEAVTVSPKSGTGRQAKVLDFLKADPKTIGLDEAETIVAGGGGISQIEDFQLLEELAKLLGGSVAASRIPVDRGWIPFDRQIGQTGVTVAPELYIACGISGSIYHTMGMKDSKLIVAINKDCNAPIFKLADMAIIGDFKEIASAIIHQLRELTNDTAAK